MRFKVRAGFRANDNILRHLNVKRKLDLPDMVVYETEHFYAYGDPVGEGNHVVYVFKQDVPNFIREDEWRLSKFLLACHELIYYSDKIQDPAMRDLEILNIEHNCYFDELGIRFRGLQEREYEDGGDPFDFKADYVLVFETL